MNGLGLTLKRTLVGDRYVLEEMRKSNYNLGGEQSGHIIMTDYMTTGDGLVAALQFLAALVERGKPASELLKNFEPFPQITRNVACSFEMDLLSKESVKKIITESEKKLGRDGRLLIRKSGTDPLIRVMAEHPDARLIEEVTQLICNEING